MKKVLITGAGGLIGSEAVSYFCKKGFTVIGVENNMRRYFFGEGGDVTWNVKRLENQHDTFKCLDLDICQEAHVQTLFSEHSFDLIIHAAAQPSHDWAAKEPLTDFRVNAQGTLNVLEQTRLRSDQAVFVYLSTNKVYGDRPNTLPFIELESRYELSDEHECYAGVDETMSVDQCKHSLFGVSKLAADMMVQEYGRYFGMKTVCFRGGCLTGQSHSGVALHGFLSYLVKCIVTGTSYTVFGYKGKQVRDNIHAFDVCLAIDHFFNDPRSAAVYNIGGTRFSNVSVLEAIGKIEKLVSKKAQISFCDDTRIGDHQWYITNMTKFKTDYPEWDLTYSIDGILEEMCRSELERLNNK